MCRNIKTLFNFEPPATELEIRDAALQFVRKLSGFSVPSKANEDAFEQAVEDVAAAARRLIGSLVTAADPRDRDVEAARARARSAARFGDRPQENAGPPRVSSTPAGSGQGRSPAPGERMKAVLRVFSIVHGFMAALFAAAALMLIVIATRLGWLAFSAGLDRGSAQEIIEAVGLLAAAVVALQIAQTITEEEVVRGAHISAPTRVRRFLSRFMVVVVVALAIEGLVATFRAAHDDAAQMLYAAALLCATGVLLASWGLFIRFNRYAEELEPEAMEDAKREDSKLE